ncbi:TetR/AcrR family transcriptional regulator [Roseovarius albus]|uniref:TetR/AcrR family transcriptional regulator n=1 Tax=Roseovarius albus TaxID=1247867 RepID=UPI000A26A3ED|nr:TetR/AcrR family transcriptional regulator [Roseovarius albus]
MSAEPVLTRSSAKRSQKEKAILKAAEKVFAELGYAGATTQLIADAASLPKANVHYYFKTKQEIYRRVVYNIFDIWMEAAAVFDTDLGPKESLSRYIDKKMDLARSHPDGSKVWAAEIMQGAPIIQDYLEGELLEWANDRSAHIQRWIANGEMDPIDPAHLLYMIWSTTQHYADFGHQINTLNGGKPLGDAQWNAAKLSIKTVILKGVGLSVE